MNVQKQHALRARHDARVELDAILSRTPRTASDTAAQRSRVRALQATITAATAVLGGDL